MREQERAPRGYELMTVLHPDVPEESLQTELDRIQGFISAVGGELIDILQDSPWGRRRLAYPIRSGGRDVRDGYYTVWHFNLGPNRVIDLERELKLDTQLIRYLIVTWEPKKLTAKEIEAAEIAAEDAAAAAYEAAQAEAAAAAAAAASEETAEDAATTAAELTAEAEALEATGAELAIEPAEPMAVEPVAAVEEREELEAEAAAALAKADVAAAEAEAAAEDAVEVPAGAVRGDGPDCPEDYPIKGNVSSMLYHIPGSPSYKRTVPEFCFASAEDAEAAGFGPTKFAAAHEEEGE